MNNTNLLREWVAASSGDKWFLDEVRESLTDHHLYEIHDPSMGGGDSKDGILDGIIRDEVATQKAYDAIASTLVSLKQIYSDKQSRLSRIYNLCLISIVTVLLLLVVSIVLAILNFQSGESADLVSIATSISSIVPGFLGGTAFLFYSKVKKESDVVENELFRTNKLLTSFKFIDLISSEEAKSKAYGEIVVSLRESLK